MRVRSERCLFVCPFLPAANAPQAGHRITFDFIRQQAERMPVDVVLLLGAGEQAPAQLIRLANVEVVGIVYVTRLQKLWTFAKGGSGLAPRFLTRLTTAAASAVEHALSVRSYTVFRAEFSQAFAFAEIVRRCDPKVRTVFSVHDIQLQLVLTKSWLEVALFSRRTFISERRLLQHADEILVLSEKDRHFVAGVYAPDAPINVQPVPLPSFISKIRRAPASIHPRSLLFWGAMGRIENQRSVLAFVNRVLRPLQKLHPDTHLYIVGSDPPISIKKLESASITVTGFVDDPGPYFEKAQWGIVPLLEGAGLKLKTIELLAAGLPVVSTPIGAEGVDINGELHVMPIEQFTSFLSDRFGGEG